MRSYFVFKLLQMIRIILSAILLSVMTSFYAKAQSDEDYSPSEEATHFPAMIWVTDGDIDETIKELQEQGITILRHRKDILLAFVPMDYPSEARKAKGVKKIEYSNPRYSSPAMHNARLFNDANLILEGRDLPQPFDGSGVVVGICDIGFDSRHPNFLTADGKECRIRKVVQYIEDFGIRKEYSTPEEIYEWETDDVDDWHATHVAGIAAGAFGATNLDANGYYGLARNADIVFTGSQLSDVGLLAGVEDIIEYAKSVDKPAVINLSMGNYVGPHDGSSLFSRYLDYCADDAIICLSAGNEGRGDVARSMSFDFTDAKKDLMVLPNDWGGVDYYGIVEIWSLDDTPFDFTFYWNNNSSFAKNLYPYDSLRFTEDDVAEWKISTDESDSESYDSTMAEHFTEGYVKAKGGISPLNGRYYVALEFQLKSEEYHPGTAWAEWWAGMKMEAEPGSHIDIFCGGNSFLRQERGYPKPDNNLCFSDLATGERNISVGMMNITEYEEGHAEGSGYAKGDVSIFSSYGTLNDGRVMPLTVAPGTWIVSSMSSANLRKYPEDLIYTDDSADFNGETYYWIGTLGTSMSCPFVAGAIATWLQAYPLLTVEDAQEIIKKTNQTSGYPNPEDPRHGQGWFNAYAGLQEVLDLAALNVNTVEDTRSAIKIIGNEIIIGNPERLQLTVDIYNTAGLHVDRQTFSDSLGRISLSGLTPGIYIVRCGKDTLKFKI